MARTLIFHIDHKPDLNGLLATVVDRYEVAFHQRIRGYYLLGSYADGYAVVGSDLDLYILFKEGWMPNEVEQGELLAHECAQMGTLRLDIKLCCESALPDEQSIMRVALKQNSMLLYGEDTRTAMTLPTRDAYRRDATDGALEFILRLRSSDTITYPLTYPDANGRFYGYDTVQRLLHEPTTSSRGTRELVECVCRIATALLTLKTERFVGTKQESVQVYQEVIGDIWVPLISEIFEKGKMRWGYALPKHEEERAELRALCEQMLAFENYYLIQYRNYLLMLLQSDVSQVRDFAMQRLNMIFENDYTGNDL